jgi:flagellum-specific ATP synthase
MPTPLAPYFQQLEHSGSVRWSGRVLQVIGNLVESEGPFCSVGDACKIHTRSDHTYAGEVVGFRGSTMLTMTLETPRGIRYGDRIVSSGARPSIRVGPELLGRVVDGTGTPIDGGGDFRSRRAMLIDGAAPLPLDRVPIREPLGCGVRTLDAFVTCGRGQRLGIFGGSGVGKSTLLGMMARGTEADLIVMALVGERGREVQEFLEVIGEEGRRRSVVVVSTSDQSPLLRLRAALSATAIAEHFAATGKNVLLVVDSLTRFAMAQREIGLAAGEPPTAKGYTPSVLGMLAKLVERAGNFKRGSITAYYTVLMEGDDQQDPVADTVRSLLDGHIILDRNLALRNHYPPISVLDSLSRLMPAVSTREHQAKARALRLLLASYTRSEDLIRIGAYQKGSDPMLDKAVECLPALQDFMQQEPSDIEPFKTTIKRLQDLPI